MIIVIDYGSGNLGSVANMIRKIGHKCIITSNPDLIAQGTKLILPGVGTFDQGMRGIQERGILPILNQKALEERVPILGVCLGAQLMTRRSDEGLISGLDWLDAETVKFSFDKLHPPPPLPNIGWRRVSIKKNADPLFGDSVISDWKFYFVHNYHFIADESLAWMYSVYKYKFICALRKDNLFCVQFHPEKSHRYGMEFFSKFLKM